MSSVSVGLRGYFKARPCRLTQKEYARCGALERINSRLDGACHFVRGRAKMKTRVGLAVRVMMAPSAARAGRTDRMHSLVKPAFADTG